MSDVRVGRGNDTLFAQAVTDAFESAVYPTSGASGDGGGVIGPTEPPVTPPTSPPGQVVQPKVLLDEWRADAAGTVDLDYTLGFPVVTAWRGAINGYELKPPSLAQAFAWIPISNVPSGRPALASDGVDDWMETVALGAKLNNLSGLSASLRLNVMPLVSPNKIARILWVESGVADVPRFGYARTNIGGVDFYADGVTRDTDPVTAMTGGVYEYEGWATHTMRRDYLNGTERVDYNAGVKVSAGGIQTINYGGSSQALRLRLGAQSGGQNAGAFQIYGFRLYTYAITDDDVQTDSDYYYGLNNA